MSGEGQDKAPPGDGSQKGDGEFVPPKDGSWIPKVRFDEALGEARRTAEREATEVLRLRAENEALKTERAKTETKPLTRADLKLLVDDGKITQDVADAHWERQIKEDAKREARAAAADEVEGRERDAVVGRQLAEYQALMPAAWQLGSPERIKVEREFKALRGLGFPDNKTTEVAALRAAFGDPEVIRVSRSTGKAGPGESHVEVGGGERPGNTAEADGVPKGLTEREKTYYADKINRGIYKDWKAVSEERKFVRP